MNVEEKRKELGRIRNNTRCMQKYYRASVPWDDWCLLVDGYQESLTEIENLIDLLFEGKTLLYKKAKE